MKTGKIRHKLVTQTLVSLLSGSGFRTISASDGKTIVTATLRNGVRRCKVATVTIIPVVLDGSNSLIGLPTGWYYCNS